MLGMRFERVAKGKRNHCMSHLTLMSLVLTSVIQLRSLLQRNEGYFVIVSKAFPPRFSPHGCHDNFFVAFLGWSVYSKMKLVCLYAACFSFVLVEK